MALLKTFVSSTCYDLNIVRSQLRQFLVNIGHDPVMSDYNDILFDPRMHTHESCVKEIENVDVVILIIGSRYGGTAIPKAVAAIDIESLKNVSKGAKLLEAPDKVSITQLEILKAIEANIPIFTFIDSKVMHEHNFYEKNKEKGFIDQLDFPSIDNRESAKYIFEFINFLRLRTKNNSISEFTKISDIENILKKQWSSLFQRLLFEQRVQKSEVRRIENISEELKDIKSLILSSITTGQARDVGRGVLKYRRMIEFFLATKNVSIVDYLLEDITWEDLLGKIDIKEFITFSIRKVREQTYLLKNDGTFYYTRLNISIIRSYMLDWSSFRKIDPSVKHEIINVIKENTSVNQLLTPLIQSNILLKDHIADSFKQEDILSQDLEKLITTINLKFDKQTTTIITDLDTDREAQV